jgi:hypothetical protein
MFDFCVDSNMKSSKNHQYGTSSPPAMFCPKISVLKNRSIHPPWPMAGMMIGIKLGKNEFTKIEDFNFQSLVQEAKYIVAINLLDGSLK